MRLVAYRGMMTRTGWRPENVEHMEDLTTLEDGKRVGRNPLELPCCVLEAAGHGPDRGRGVVGRYNLAFDTSHDAKTPLTHLRSALCIPCKHGNVAEVRRCCIIDCPVWPYRMGRNPHNPRRGVNPFEGK